MEMILLLSVVFLISQSTAQRLPHISCPQYFEYLSFNGQFIGHITIHHDPLYDVNNLVVEFSQYGAYDWVGTKIYHIRCFRMHSLFFPVCSYHTLTPHINSLLSKTERQ